MPQEAMGEAREAPGGTRWPGKPPRMRREAPGGPGTPRDAREAPGGSGDAPGGESPGRAPGGVSQICVF